jgi:hypothetical protein
MTYRRVSTKWCTKHRGRPAGLRQWIRKLLGRPYYVRPRMCDCPSVRVEVPLTYHGGFG